MTMAQPQMNGIQQNLALRQALLASAPRMTKKVGTFTESTSPEGRTTRIKLFNVGILTKLRLKVTANVTIATDALTASPKAPWNSISQLKVTDFEGVDRVNVSGFQLWTLQSNRMRTPAFINNEGMAAVSALPFVPTAISTDDIEFYIEVPLAYDDERDLRGAILAQTATGEMFLNITWNNDFLQDGNEDGVYSADGTNGTCVVNSITVDVYQDYLLPQSIGGQIPIPQADLLTVYEINGNYRITDNISNGQERLLNYPNMRSVIGFYANWFNAGALADSISTFRLIANGNNILREDSLHTQLMTQRNWINGDLKKGVYWQNHRARPIETALYGNVQCGLTFNASASGTYYLEQMTEAFYTKGAVLPGMTNQ